MPFAYNWSRHSRKIEGPSAADAKRMMTNIREFSEEYLAEHPEINYFIFGHLHLLEDIRLSERCRMIVLGEWISTCSYAVWNGEELELKICKDL